MSSGAPSLPHLPSNFGNDSPFPPPSAAPRIPSARYLASASAPPLPPLRDEALEREQKLRHQEQYKMHASSSNGSMSGLRPGQFIQSNAYAVAATSTPPPKQQAPIVQHPRMVSSPLPIAASPVRKPMMPMPVPSVSPLPPPKIPIGQQGPKQISHHPPIQRPATSEPKIRHSDQPSSAMATAVASASASMESMHLYPQRVGAGAGDQQRRRVDSNNDSQQWGSSTQQRETRGTASDSSNNNNNQPASPTLNVILPDLNALGATRDRALASNTDSKTKLGWCKDVIKYIERKSDGAKISDAKLVQYIDEAIGVINQLASAKPPKPEALFLRGDLLASGAFPAYHAKSLKAAFNDFELSARMGYAPSWFRIGRDYEILGDNARAKDVYERGCAVGDVGCIYRMGMANLLSQLDLPMNHEQAISLLKEAADLANLDTPQPAYIYGMLLAGEFSHVEVAPRLLVPTPDPKNLLQPATIESEARRRIQRAAYLNFGPAQYRCGWSYEYAQLECSFDPLLSVQYYSLASQAGEVEADLALSKWFLCGAEGCFDKNESLAFTFAEKAARKGLPSAEFAMGYYFEVGVGCEKNINVAQKWYKKASSHGNNDAKERLAELEGPSPNTLSRRQHEAHVDTQLVRKRTEAKMKSDRKSKMMAAKDRRTASEAVDQAQSISNPIASQHPTDVRRRMTMRLVEETAQRSHQPKIFDRSAEPTPDWERRGSAPAPMPSSAQSAATQQRAPAQPPRLAIPNNNMNTGYHSGVNSPGPSPISKPSPLGQSRPSPFKNGNDGHYNNYNGGNGQVRPSQNHITSSNSAPSGMTGTTTKSSTSSDSQKQKFETFGEMGFTAKKTRDEKDCIIC